MDDGKKNDGLYFKINEVAKQVGVVPATIRNWEKSGLITIRRSPSGYRIFDLDDIEFLKKIRQKSKDENVGINGIRILCQDPRPARLSKGTQEESQGSGVVSKQLLSSKWKEYRLARGYSLEDVAALVGVSSSYLSKIENRQANVSYEVLGKLAGFYGQNILFYLNDSDASSPIVKKGATEPFEIGIPGLTVESVIAQKKHTLAAMIYTAAPGSEHAEPSAHTGEEFIYMLSGKVEFILDDQHFMLSPGDSLSFNSSTLHRWRNTGNRESRFLWVYTPVLAL